MALPMDTTTFTALVTWVIAHGYFLFFIAALLEGPLVTAAAGVAAGLGYYNISIIGILAIMGDLGADVIFYGIGYVSRRSLVDRYGPRFGLTVGHMDRIEAFIHRHLIKALAIVKLSGVIAVPSLIIIGSSRASIKKFTIACLFISVPKSLLFALLGFYSGKAYAYLSETITNSQYILSGIVVLFILLYIAYKKLSTYIAHKLEGNRDIV